ncbi:MULTISPECIES: hypothetical protein [Natrialbaceae]|nr:hypothetical protein [Natronococcus sp. CG52]
MGCDNCRTDEVAYTLTTHTDSTPGESVDLYFCSADCLRAWT